jgi:hypothetical protein
LTPKRVRPHSIITPDHIAHFCMACILSVGAARRILAPFCLGRIAAILLFAILLIAKTAKKRERRRGRARFAGTRTRASASVSPILLSRFPVKANVQAACEACRRRRRVNMAGRARLGVSQNCSNRRV